MIPDVLFYLMVGFLVTHELDAVKRHEWRIFPVLGLLTDKAGERIFIWLHGPVFAVLLFLADGNAVNRVRVGLAAFAIVHVGLHWICRTHPANEFNNASSWALILGTGAMGATYLVAAGMM